ncbi:hypothetical protein OBBRIDRAFT_826327 [Obba rivulosa]|uniref:Uncharacterized protein n=1 Tax=Obba rivulosa TaxID=1052685 RepID=A0A8E2AWU9_9APHY|nr:hypothetical protein OBBRIDRAFT_826327 [Obba rivulosa]
MAEAAEWQQRMFHRIDRFSTGDIHDPQSWIAVGRPISVSMSPQGRGTLVWKVFNVYGVQAISAQNEESDISEAEKTLKAERARLCPPFINTIARPLFQCHTELELPKGLCVALAGHEFLWTNFTTHGPLSAGAVFLVDGNSFQRDGGEGFLINTELTCYSPSQDANQQRTHFPDTERPGHKAEPTTAAHTRLYQTVQHHAPMTRMDLESPEDMAIAELIPDVKALVQAPEYHIEPFLCILCYALLRHLAGATDPRMTDTKGLVQVFYDCLRHVRFASLSTAPTDQGPLSMVDFPAVRRALSDPMAALLECIRGSCTEPQLAGPGAAVDFTHGQSSLSWMTRYHLGT